MSLPNRGHKALPALAALALFLTAPAAPAAVLSQYTFTGANSTAETGAQYNPSTLLPGLTASPVSDPAGTIGIEISSAATTPANAPFLRVDPQGNALNPAAANTANKYFQFSLTAAADPTADLDLTDLTFNVARGGGSTPRGFFVRSSADNFTSFIPVTGAPALTVNGIGYDVNTARPTYTAVTADLSGPLYQNIQNQPGDTITFRIYAYSPGAGSSIDFDDITINGTAVVPEPTGLGLVALATLAALRRQRP